MKASILAKAIFSVSVSPLALAAMTMPAFAQAAAADAPQENSTDSAAKSDKAAPAELPGSSGIVVKGYKQSLEASLGLKRNSTQIIDAITAEDINDFPDQNIIESLARITGVQITRDSNGEGDRFQVRGLSDVRVEVDGQRQVGGRYDGGLVGSALPSELFGQVQVIKTQAADDTEGGTGGIVRFNTYNPLDRKKDFTLNASGQANYSNNAREWGYNASGTIAKNFRDTSIGDIGILVSYTRNRTVGQADQFRAGDGYQVDNTLSGDFNGNGTPNEATTYRTVNGAQVVDKLGDGLIRPSGSVGAQYESIRRTEQSFNANLQWKPTDTLNIYARTTRTYQANRSNVTTFNVSSRPLANWNPASLEIQDQVVVAGTIVDAGGVNTIAQAQGFNINQNTVQAGIDWQATSRFKASFKFEDGSGRTFNPLRIPIGGQLFGRTTTTRFDLRTAVPTVLPLNADGTPFDFGQPISGSFNPAVIGIFDADIRESQRDRAYQLDFDYDAEWGWIKKIEFGARYNVQRNRLSNMTYSQFDFDGQDPQLPFRFQFYQDLEQNIPGILVQYNRPNSFGGKNNGNIPTSFTVQDPEFFRSAAYQNTYRANNFTNPNGTPVGPVVNLGDQRDGRYEIIAGYVKLNLAGDTPWLNLPFRGNIGLRVVNTKQRVYGITLNDQNQSVPGFTSGENTQFLPSLSLAFDLAKNLIGRFGLGRTIARPGLESLVPNELIQYSLNTVQQGNGNLQPVRSDGIDIGFEWYFNKTGLLSFAGFYKHQSNLAAQFASLQCLRDPESPAIRVDQTGAIARNQQGIDVCTAAGLGSDADLRAYDGFTVTRTGNIGSNDIKGFEIGYQQYFSFLPAPFDGFGAQANYTFTTGRNPLVSPLGNSLPLLGVSKHSYNATVFYEKYGLSTRLSYNYRSRYLGNGLTGLQDNIGVSPAIRAGFGQLDGSMSYAITKQVTVSFDAINILSAPQINYADFRSALLTKTQTDRRFFFGLRTSF